MTAIPKPAYVMSEPHLSGWRVVLGYETLADAQAAQSAVSAPEACEGEAVAGDRALAFFKWARDIFWNDDGYEIGGGDFQDAAERLGLIVKVPFDPERHADNGYGLEAGDDWYETEPAVQLALYAHPSAPSADKLRETFEDIKSAADSFRDCEGDEVAHQVIIRCDQALAALNAEG